MKKILIGLMIVGCSVAANANSEIGVTDMATCTAAAMKSGVGAKVYTKWADALLKKYQSIYPNKSFNEVDSYTSERILDKKRRLQSKGYDTTLAFKKYYDINCKDYETSIMK